MLIGTLSGNKRVVPGWTEQVEVQVLTPRERLIVHLIAEGYSNKEIAELLGLSVKTIETDRAAVKRKLDVKSLAALVRYADSRWGWCSPRGRLATVLSIRRGAARRPRCPPCRRAAT